MPLVCELRIADENRPRRTRQDCAHMPQRGMVSIGWRESRWRQIVKAIVYPAASTASTTAELKSPPGYAKQSALVESLCCSTLRETAASCCTRSGVSFVRK